MSLVFVCQMEVGGESAVVSLSVDDPAAVNLRHRERVRELLEVEVRLSSASSTVCLSNHDLAELQSGERH